MVQYSPDALDATFSALSDPTRRAILTRLADGEATVGEVAAPFDMSLPAVSKHLRVLQDAGLLTRERDGRLRRCRLMAEPLGDAIGWMVSCGRFWEAQLDSLGEYLAGSPQQERD